MPDRRPLASRDTKIAAKIAASLATAGVAPNLISQTSILFAALAGLLLWAVAWIDGGAQSLCLLGAALGCQLRLLCNLLDGMVAVEGGLGTPQGAFWNEMPDRLADVLILVGLGLAVGEPALGWAASAGAVATAYTRALGSELGLPADFRGPMAKPHRMAAVTAGAVLAAVTPTVLGVPVLLSVLWIVALGSVVTVLRRSHRLLGALKARSDARDG
ncbi:CDP-diacylglycerol--glycerol-3-phosphate 3-phosphatidyltransferase [Actibacterium mucosum KCTC 23349]|uniref:CDP-diacylglycerol--glycerol-3-phosphate 3-phosphatidyltransferase n=1 Tax=Actibacterium mucosum KCTC 23349 TaxID=1454373 RepID=A0A037ZCS8_9RHOB|nr:CDP-alcohol phosphatidyltransferase family protein [Actibacterium mucosum]KAJ54304.1 CDP-diacylglycerol--glycerol-3-phosphate 3-phosphatidyltransferase [Actibacterium mucosum KCTC 23349]